MKAILVSWTIVLAVAATLIVLAVSDQRTRAAAPNPNGWTDTDREFLIGLRTVRDQAGHCFMYERNSTEHGYPVYTFAVVNSTWCGPTGAPER